MVKEERKGSKRRRKEVVMVEGKGTTKREKGTRKREKGKRGKEEGEREKGEGRWRKGEGRWRKGEREKGEEKESSYLVAI